MAFRLQVKRGTVAPNSVLHAGELGFDTVAKKLYVGNGTGVAETGVSMDGHAHAASAITSGEFDIARIPTITVAKGGTNISSYNSGDILYASGSTTLSKLGIGSANQVLTVVSGVPAWSNAASINNGTLALEISATSGTSGVAFEIGTGTGFSANASSNYTYSLEIGPALSALATVMSGATTGFIKKSAADTYTLDTNTYITSGGTAGSVANSLVLKIKTGSTEGTSLYTFNGSAAKTLDFLEGNGIDLTAGSGTLTIAHEDTSSQASVTASGRTYITGVTLDTYGHVTALTTGTETVVDTNTTYSISAETATGGANLRLTDSASGTDDVKFASGTDITVARTDANTITISHNDTSAITGQQGTNGVSSITIDGNGHVTAVGTATYLTAESDTLDTVTGRGATTSNNITVGDIAVNGGDITTNQATFNIGNTATSTQTINLGTAATANTNTKTINIGTGSAAGSTTDVYLGSTSGTSTVRIQGNLVVTGTSSSINAETVTVDDNIIVLNNNVTGSPTENAGIEVERGTSANVSLLWNESSDRWTFTNDGSTYYNIPISSEYSTGTITSVVAGNGMSFTTVTSGAATVTMGTPGTLTDATSNSASAGTHTHAITTYGVTGESSVVTVSGGKVLGSALSISLASAYGDTKNPYGSKTANHVLAAPNGSAGVPSFRALALADLPSISLDNLSDVIITTAATDNLLQYNGSNWVNVASLDCGTY